jgi:two-component system, LytTR family, response regulator
MIEALIVDDEELARRGLEIRLREYEDVSVCGESRNGREALEHIRTLRPDLVFLDIQMPGMDGFEVLRRLSVTEMPAVIFVTAFSEFAIRAFEAEALDYLLKPIDDLRLAGAMERTRKFFATRRAAEHRQRLLRLVCSLTGREMSLEHALAGEPYERFPKRLAIRDRGETHCVEMAAIDWIDAAGDYLCIHAAGDTFVMRGTLKRLEKALDPADFVRVHRSAVVNRHRVTAMRAHRNGEYFLKLGDEAELKLSRKYKHNLPRLADRI